MSGYSKIVDDVARFYGLSGNVLKTLLVLMGFCYGSRFECWPSHDTLAKATGFSRRTIITHLFILRAQGFISWKWGDKGRANHYIMLLKAQDPDIQRSFRKLLPTLHPMLRKKTPGWKWLELARKGGHLVRR